MCALDPHTEPERFYEFAVRQCERGLPVVGDRVPEERHVEMLRLRLIEGLTLHQVGERMDLSGVRVHQLLNGFFGLRRASRDTEGDPEKVKVPAGFIDLMREMVLREREEGREMIVRALWLREALEWQRLRGAKGVERRMVWWHLRQIGVFLASVGIADEVLRRVRSMRRRFRWRALARLGSWPAGSRSASRSSHAARRCGRCWR
jgi:hypothetical protein